jgi:signal peptidase II
MVIVVDQVSKFLVGNSGGEMVLNTGISFGLFSNLAIWLSLVGLVVLSWWGRHTLTQQPLSMGLIWGGALSNLLDRVVWGGVQDWLALPGMPFRNNLADVAISLGVVWGLYATYVRRKNYDT